MNDLTLAIVGNSEKDVERAIAAGADVNAVDIGRTPLARAASDGQHAIVARLLAAGANPRAKDEIGSALRAAVQGGHAEVVEQLIAAGAKVDERDSMGSSLFCHAVATGSVRIVRAFLEASAKPAKHERPLLLALRDNHLDVARVLIQAGADVDRGTDGPLLTDLIGWRKVTPAAIELLLEHGADAELTDGLGRTALEVARRERKPKLAAVLAAQAKKSRRS
jgi:ankyrin repeat protein